ncbi:hypothetical protein HY029_00410 [Candidatus Gottesmanbacteria bacterium]|nr:hypothetical protein [Candidatus Gottesmanbacteria bacterium]
MLTLIHGDDIVSSTKVLEDIKTRYPDYEKVYLRGTTSTLTDVVIATDSLSLFASQKLVIIENLIEGADADKKDKILSFLTEKKTSCEVVIIEQKEISKTILKKYFAQAKTILCQIPAILFKFLDSIGDKSVPQVLSMYHQITDNRDPEFIISMLIRQWRNLIIASDLGESGFSGMPSWQSYKFIKQARFFTLPSLILSYRQLLSLDLKVKMGLSPYTLRQLLDIFFVSLYYEF